LVVKVLLDIQGRAALIMDQQAPVVVVVAAVITPLISVAVAAGALAYLVKVVMAPPAP
jgi:AmiR/NasT family two-component response regulator